MTPLTAHAILTEVCTKHAVAPKDVLGNVRGSSMRHLTIPRHEAMRRIRVELGWSYPHIGTFFGGRHHTTVLRAMTGVENEARAAQRAAATVESELRLQARIIGRQAETISDLTLALARARSGERPMSNDPRQKQREAAEEAAEEEFLGSLSALVDGLREFAELARVAGACFIAEVERLNAAAEGFRANTEDSALILHAKAAQAGLAGAAEQLQNSQMSWGGLLLASEGGRLVQ